MPNYDCVGSKRLSKKALLIGMGRITSCYFGRKPAGARSYGPETIYMFGDLEEGTYAVMAYVVSSTGLDKFEGCEAISMFSG